jgi:hydroxymethylpyrimidine pyrophosphatase-like HAD family hydrolase
MGNANDTVKESADYVALSIEEDGLAHSFKSIFKL